MDIGTKSGIINFCIALFFIVILSLQLFLGELNQGISDFTSNVLSRTGLIDPYNNLIAADIEYTREVIIRRTSIIHQAYFFFLVNGAVCLLSSLAIALTGTGIKSSTEKVRKTYLAAGLTLSSGLCCWYFIGIPQNIYYYSTLSPQRFFGRVIILSSTPVLLHTCIISIRRIFER